MILGLFTLFHIIISIVGIVSGFVVLAAMLASRNLDRWNTIFLVTTIATSVTGFFFPRDHFLPAHGVGTVSLVGLGVAAYALYGQKLAGGWRKVYAGAAVFSLYLNVFVLVAQEFQKVPVLRDIAPTQAEWPFLATQILVMAAFVAFGWLATVRFRAY